MALNIVVLSVANKPYYAECCYEEGRYAECRGAKFGSNAEMGFFCIESQILDKLGCFVYI